MKKYIWIIDFYVRDPMDNETHAYCVKVRENNLQDAITKACHLVDGEYRHAGVQYFVHNAGLAEGEDHIDQIWPDPFGDPEPDEFAW